MRFSDIQGNDAVVSALRNMVDGGRIPHAMLLHENDGGGAFPIVLAFLAHLYASASTRVDKLMHPDVHFVFPVTTGSKSGSERKPLSDTYMTDFRELVLSNPFFTEEDLYEALGIEGKSGNISVLEARTLLDKLSLSSVEGGFRSVVLYLPEKMNVQAANALLKMVEEPPENTLFLMITHAPERVMQTIFSRCLFMRVVPPAAHVESRPQEGEDSSLSDLAADLLEAVSAGNLLSVLEAGEAADDLKAREKQKTFLKLLSEDLRNIFMLQQGQENLVKVPAGEMEFLRRTALSLKKTFPRQAISHVDRAALLLERNVNQKILFCDLVAKLYMISR
jgi:DNA polymerase-3 subunit delta'